MKTLSSLEEGHIMVSLVSRMIKWCHEKDVFLRQFEKLTAMRLINETSVSKDAEELMLDSLKSNVGVKQCKRLR